MRSLILVALLALGCATLGVAGQRADAGESAPAVASAASSSSSTPAASSPAAPSRTVRIGLYQNEPKVFTDAAGRPAGFFVDLFDAIGRAEGWRVVWVPAEWEAGLEALENGRLDLMPDVAITEERTAVLDFNKTPVIESWSQLYVDRDLPLGGFQSLHGKRVAVLDGSVQQEEFAQIVSGLGIRVTLVPVESYQRAFEMTRDGSVDAAIANRFFGDHFYRSYGLTRSDVVFNLTSLYFATGKGQHEDLLTAIDRHLRAWKDQPDSPYYAALTRWLEQPSTTSTEYRVSRWLTWTLGIIAVLLFATTVGVVLSRRQVKAQTRHLTEANEALSVAHQQLENIIEFLPDATIVIDEAKRVVAWNRACETMTGVKKDAVMGRDDFAYAVPFYGERRPVLIDLLDAPAAELGAGYDHVERAGDTITGEAWNPELRGGEGARLWCAAAPLFDGDGRRSGAIEVLRDVTEQRRVEMALFDNERKYRELVEHANSIILRWTRDGRITFLNEFGQRFFGYGAEEIEGRPVMGTIVPMSDTYGRDLGDLMERILADPVAFEQSVNENMLRSGERVWIAWTNKTVLDAEGEVAEILSVGTDITRLKQAEKEIRELNTTLERRVALRTAELAVARDRAEAADRLKSAFLATMSHELRTPLNSIIGFTGILLQEMAGPLGAEQRKQLEMVRDSSRHLLALINDVLDISKIEAGQMTVGSEPFDLRVSIENAVGLVRPLAEKKQLVLGTMLASGIGTLVSDPRRVEQVLINLLNNAIKFTDEGAVTVGAEITPPGMDAPHATIRISVTDTGIGIRPEDLAELFQPFRQVDTGLARQHEGTGLGLAICRRLAELLGGAVTAESEWGRGSVFTLTLPMDTNDAPEVNLP